jgi:hypothetical protein
MATADRELCSAISIKRTYLPEKTLGIDIQTWIHNPIIKFNVPFGIDSGLEASIEAFGATHHCRGPYDWVSLFCSVETLAQSP